MADLSSITAPRPRAPSTAWLVGSALLPGAVALAYDVIARREMFVNRAGPPIGGYIAGAFLSLILWALIIEVARHPKRAVRVAALAVLGVMAAFGLGGQLLFHATAHEYFNRDAVIFSIHMWPIIADYLLLSPFLNAVVILGAAAIVVGYAMARYRQAGPRRRFAGASAGLAVAVCLFAAFGPFRAPSSKHGLPPEMLFLHAAGGVGLYGVGLLDPPQALPPGQHTAPPDAPAPAGANAPSIILIFGESVRKDEVCASRSPDCKKNPRLDAAAPDRIGFVHSFSVASCTEVASAILWTGLPITSKGPLMQTAPLLWDYAKARGYRTAYLTSQNLSFQDQGLFLRTSRIDEKREARDRDQHADLDIGSPDEVSAAETLAFLAKESGPAFAVFHLSNTHLPYRQVPGETPHAASGEETEIRRAHYLNSLVHQDNVIGDFLAELRKTELGKKAIVIYTADHGEAWGEHGSYTHTFDLYAEQIDIPVWIDAPEGSLTPDQLKELRAAAADRPLFTADVSATVLDLLGALDEPGFKPHIEKLAGASVLRPAPPPRDMDLSNCPPFRTCYPEAWGIVRWPIKYHYLGRTVLSACSDILADPTEKAGLPAARCADLHAITTTRYGFRPDATFLMTPSASASASPSAAPPGSP